MKLSDGSSHFVLIPSWQRGPGQSRIGYQLSRGGFNLTVRWRDRWTCKWSWWCWMSSGQLAQSCQPQQSWWRHQSGTQGEDRSAQVDNIKSCLSPDRILTFLLLMIGCFRRILMTKTPLLTLVSSVMKLSGISLRLSSGTLLTSSVLSVQDNPLNPNFARIWSNLCLEVWAAACWNVRSERTHDTSTICNKELFNFSGRQQFCVGGELQHNM